MIYSKKANFPFPVLANYSNGYKESEFEFDVSLHDNTDDFFFDVKYKISSEFIKGLIKNHKARVILIIKSKDNQFHVLGDEKKTVVKIPKSRLSIGNRTVLQLMIQSTEEIDFSMNKDLNDFYDSQKENIKVSKGMALGFSNLVTFDGSQSKPYDLFERKVDKKIQSDLEIRLGEETIMIVYKTEEMQFSDMANHTELNYPYIYIGLQKALVNFISHYSRGIDEGVDLATLEIFTNPLDEKLYSLMQAKKIDEISLDNIDKVIYLISGGLLKKYTNSVRGMNYGS